MLKEEDDLREKHKAHRQATGIKPKTLHEAVPVAIPWVFGGFHRNSAIRNACFYVQNSLHWQTAFVVITVANSLYIATAPGYTDELSILISWYFDLICAIIFGLEVMSGVIAYGAFQGKTTYLHNDTFHSIDMMCLFFIVTEYGFQYWEMWPALTMRPFRMVRIFKPATKIKMFAGIKNIVTTLRDGSPQLAIIFGFFFLTMIAWDILFMSLYSTSFRRRCVSVEIQVPECASDFSTGFNSTCDFKTKGSATASSKTVLQPGGIPVISGGYPFESYCKILGTEHDKDSNGNWIEPKPKGNLVERGYYDYGKSIVGTSWPKSNGVYHSCQDKEWRNAQKNGLKYEVTQECQDLGPSGNPMKGFSHFDNVWGASCSLFQVMIPDSYYDVWFRAMQSDPDLKYLTGILFPIITVLDTFLLLGLFVAVVTGTFKRIRQEQQASQFSNLTKDEEEDLSPFKSPSKESYLDAEIVIKDEFTQLQTAARYWSKYWAFELTTQLVIIWHVITMAVDTRDNDSLWINICWWSNLACTFYFLFECTLNLLARGTFKRFFQRHRSEFILGIRLAHCSNGSSTFRLGQ